MNILLINHYAGSKYHGMEYRPYYMAKEWIQAGHNVTIIAASESHVRTKKPDIKGELTEEIIDGITYIWLRTSSYGEPIAERVINLFSFLTKIIKYEKDFVTKYKPDVVIASSTYPLDTYPAYRIAKKARAKLVYEVHDLWPLSPMELGGYSKYHPFIMFLQAAEDFGYKKSDVVVSMLPNAKEHMIEHGMKPEKFVHIPNGIDIEEWENDKSEIPSEHKEIIARLKAERKFLIGYAGAHGLANALHSLVTAASIIQDVPVSIVLVGRGPEKELLQKQAAELGLNNIVFLPAINKSAIPDLLSRMDSLYIGLQKQSLFRFGVSPNKLFDYMMASKPVIYAIEAGNDMVADSGCGISIPSEDPQALADAIIQIMNKTEEERVLMGAKGKKYVLEDNDYRILAKKFTDAVSSV